MKLKFLLQLPAAALLVFCLSSCDGGGGDGGGGGGGDNNNPFNLDSRYDRSTLEQDLLGTAAMPRNLISTDKLTYTPNDDSQLTNNNINLPRSTGQSPWVLVPDVAGAVEIENYIYTYALDPPALDDDGVPLDPPTNEDGAVIEGGGRGVDSGAVDAVGDAGINRNASWGSVRPTVSIVDEPKITEAGRLILQDALSGLGFLSVVTPNVVPPSNAPYFKLVSQDPPVFLNGSEIFIAEEAAWQIEGIMLLKKRKITHTVTSTNEDILNSGLIRGTFTLNDTYENLYFVQTASTDGAWEVRSGKLTIADIPVESSQPQEISPVVTGEFTIELGDGGFGIGDPNP